MKTKNYLFCILLMLFTGFYQSFAQVKLGLEISPALPLGDFEDAFETGVGGKLKFRYFLSEQLAIGADLGYYSFNYEFNDEVNFRSVPFTFQTDYYFRAQGVKPYLGAGLGVYINSIDFGNSNRFGDDDETELGLNLGGGVLFNVGNNVDLGGDLRFHLVDDASFATLGFVLLFGLK